MYAPKVNTEITTPSKIYKHEFFTEYIKTVNNSFLKYLNNNVDRFDCIREFSLLLTNIDVAIKIEAGIYEFAVVYCSTKKFHKDMMVSVYNDKKDNIYESLKNKDVKDKLLVALSKNQINPQRLAFMKPHELSPESWTELIRKNNLREEKKKNITTTDLYQCYKCKERKCHTALVQLRSADEPMTLIITCMNCHNVMKK